MKRRLALRTLLVAVVALAAASLLFVSQRGASAAAGVYIVELSADPVVVAKHRAESAGQAFDVESYRRQVVAQQNDFLGRLAAKGVVFNVVGVDAPNGPAGEVSRIQFRFNYVYNGVTLAVPATAVPVIEKMSGVKSVHADTGLEMYLDRAVKYVRAPELYGNPPQVRMGDALQTSGVHGEGVYIAVIDTGIDWTNPMFGGDPTPPRFGVGPAVAAVNHNQKVPYYLNLTAGAAADDFGHGTHVAGIAAGYLANAPGPDGLPLTADDVPIHGVAPQAKLMGYKVLTAVGSGVGASTIMAVEDAVQPFTVAGYPKPVAHVINLSLGDTSNDPDSPSAVACDNATLAGVTVVAAAGNSGSPTPTNPSGEGTLGSPGTGRRVLTVGASLDPGAGPNKIDEVGGRSSMAGFPLDGTAPIASDITNNYVYCGLGDTPDQFPDSVAGKIALIKRGSTATVEAAGQGTGAFSNKAAFATAKGAVAVLIYNNVDGELTNATVRKAIIPVLGLSKANGEYLKAAIGSDAVGAVSVKQVRINKSVFFEPSMGDFSSKGPVGRFGMIKPDVVAPGVSILSATIRVGGAEPAPGGVPPAVWMFDPTGFTSASGTSMATPMTAGVAALVKQKNPSWTPSMIRAALMNTATNLRASDGTPQPDGAQTINTQGAGLIDAAAAANAKALMGVGAIDRGAGAPSARTYGLLDSASPGNPDFLGSHSFGAVPVAGVEGTATLTQTVTIFDVRDGAGAGTYEFFVGNVRGVDDRDVRVSFSRTDGTPASSVEVPAGGSASINVNVTVSGAKLADPTQLQWYVTAAREDFAQTLRMPFYLRAVKPALAAAAPTMGDVAGAEVADATPVDIDGAYRLQFAKPSTGAQAAKLRVQESTDGGATWATLADVDASRTTYDVAGRPNGDYQYRAVGLYPVEYGMAAGPESASKAVRVDRRVEQDVTSAVQATILDGTVSFSGGAAQFDQTLRNGSASSLYAPLRFVVTSVQSNSGRVAVANADNGGTGAAGSPAAFDYSATFGPDLAPNEASAAKRLRFANPANEMFQFTAVVYAHVPDPAYAPAAPSAGGESGASSSASSGSTGGSGTGATGTLGTLLTTQPRVLKFTVNPLTGKVSLLK
ncbi:MAG TPA: S8 family serine peptidase [Pyrinomonadaceae bacterium]|jgi:subtilisin family serine protease